MARPQQLGLADAVDAYVDDGATVYIGNFGATLYAVGHELIRQGRSRLHVVMTSGGILVDQFIGAGVLAEVTFSHCWNTIGPAAASCFRRHVESGAGGVVFHELSIGILNAALTAGAWGVPFMPVRRLAGTGYADGGWHRGLLASASSPFGDASVVQAIEPDVAFVHLDAVTPSGNGLLRTPRGETVVAAQAARRVVVVAEEAVDDAVARAEPTAVAIPGVLVDAVVVASGGLHPDGAAGRYQRDVAFYEQYAQATRTEDGFAAWMDEWVLGVADHHEYRQRVEASR